MRRAACVFVRNHSGRILAVARRGTKDQWGLPGGKITDEEYSRDLENKAAVRELEEETGVIVPPDKLDLLYENMDGHGYICTTFIAKFEDIKAPQNLTGDAGPVAWITESELLSGPFAGYNAAVLKAEKEESEICDFTISN